MSKTEALMTVREFKHHGKEWLKAWKVRRKQMLALRDAKDRAAVANQVLAAATEDFQRAATAEEYLRGVLQDSALQVFWRLPQPDPDHADADWQEILSLLKEVEDLGS